LAGRLVGKLLGLLP